MSDPIQAAARAIGQAKALLITAGAGLGADSGLPTFRGDEGFWNAYPPYRHLGLSFVQMANPRWFTEKPELAWGFYGHRMELYRRVRPHPGFQTLKRLGEARPLGYFVFTSNVDGHFFTAGFPEDRVVECHGSINHVQCLDPNCSEQILPADDIYIDVDPQTFEARPPLPRCPKCRYGLLRPNVLMFGDWGWVPHRSQAQEDRMLAWLAAIPLGVPTAVIELGAGVAVQTVRRASESLMGRRGSTLIRINPDEPEVSPPGIPIKMGALAALEAIEKEMVPA